MKLKQAKAPSVATKEQREMLIIAQNVSLPDTLKEGKNYVAIGCQYGIKESSVRCIKEESTKFRTLRALKREKCERILPCV